MTRFALIVVMAIAPTGALAADMPVKPQRAPATAPTLLPPWGPGWGEKLTPEQAKAEKARMQVPRTAAPKAKVPPHRPWWKIW